MSKRRLPVTTERDQTTGHSHSGCPFFELLRTTRRELVHGLGYGMRPVVAGGIEIDAQFAQRFQLVATLLRDRELSHGV